MKVTYPISRLMLLLTFATPMVGFAEQSSMSYQDSKAVRFGVQAGLTFNQLSSPKEVSVDNRNGLAAGANIEIPLTSYLAIQPELLFVQRKAEFTVSKQYRYEVSYNSLEVPLFAKVRLGDTLSPFLIAGPVAYFNLAKNVSAVTPNGTVSAGFNPKTVDFGAAIGAGFHVGPMFADVRYTVGITDLDENGADWKSRGIHVLAGLRI